MNNNELNEYDTQHIAESIQQGNTSGDLNTDDQRGWWKLEFEKWEE